MADEIARKAGILNDFDVSIGKIRQLVQDRETNSNTLIKTITDNISAIDEKINELKGISDTAAETYNRIKRELEECKARSSDQERIINQKTQEAAQIAAQKQNVEQELAILHPINDRNVAKIAELQGEIDQHEEVMNQLTSELQPLRDAKISLDAQVADLTRSNTEKNVQIKDIEERDRHIAELTHEIQERIKHIQLMEQQIADKDRQITELSTHDNDNTTRIQDLERNLTELTALQQTKEQELAALKAENADLINRIMGATRAITEAMDTLEQLRTSKRTENTAKLLQKFQDTTALIQGISNSLQGLRGGRRYKKQKTRKTRKTKKMKKMKGGFIYGTSSSSKRKSPKKRSSSSRSSSSSNNKYKKIRKNKF